jgi:Flp pilus assembly protein TadG
MKRLLKYYKEKKGISLVLIALFLAVLLMLLGVAVDLSYMYYVKNQLQVAADAASLAGAANLSGSGIAQPGARSSAWQFACKNRAADNPKNVFLVTAPSNPDSPTCDNTDTPPNLNNGNDFDGDIVVGNWNPNRPQTPVDLRFRPTAGNPLLAGDAINAVKVVARRTGDAPVPNVKIGYNAVRVFIGQVFRLIGINWSYMSARATAIAARLPRAIAPIAICYDTCTPGVILSTGTLLYWSPYPSEVIPGNVGIAWTSFNESSQSMEKDIINSFFCGGEKDACNLIVYTTNGYDNDLARQFRCAFKNPLYDSDYKTCTDGKCDSISDNVTSWNVLVPIFVSPDGCPPGDQPAPDTVIAYGRLNIIEVYASGGGGKNECACGAYDATKLNGPNAILANSIECVDCPALDIIGRRPILVK